MTKNTTLFLEFLKLKGEKRAGRIEKGIDKYLVGMNTLLDPESEGKSRKEFVRRHRK